MLQGTSIRKAPQAPSSPVSRQESSPSTPKTRRAQLVAFLRTPQGWFFTIYGICVFFWGATLTLFLLQWLKLKDERQYKIWVEICSQVLNGLFTLTGLGFLPMRIINMSRMCTIIKYSRKIWSSLKVEDTCVGGVNGVDKNDILSLLEQYGPSSREEAGRPRVGSVELNEQEVLKLTGALKRLSRSQTWYRHRATATHWAFPVYGALAILLLDIGNSIGQIGLCSVMWGLSGRRPRFCPWHSRVRFLVVFLSGGLEPAFASGRYLFVPKSRSLTTVEDLKPKLKKTKV